MTVDLDADVPVASPQSTGVLAINAHGGDDQITGGAGSDTVTGAAGNDTIDGASGIDTAHYTGSIATDNVVATGLAWQVTAGTEGIDSEQC